MVGQSGTEGHVMVVQFGTLDRCDGSVVWYRGTDVAAM
jgi:hypothetical protein